MVVLGEEDLADRAEILRNMYRRITPPDLPLVQDVGTWPAAWEEFGANWVSAALEREYGTWVVPVEVTQNSGATVLKDVIGSVMWQGTTDFSRPESADVVLTGGLVAEEDWAAYEGVRDAVATMTAEVAREDIPGRTQTNEPSGLRFTAHEWTTNDTFRLELAYEIDTNVDIFAYAVAHTSAWVVATWTNDENVAITDTNLVWYPAGPSFNGKESDWEQCGTVAIDNGVAEFEDSGFPAPLGRVRFYAAAVAQDLDGDGLNDGVEVFVTHTDPANNDSDGDGIDDFTEHISGSAPMVSNVWWRMKSTNYWFDYGHQYLGNQPSWPDFPVWQTNLTVTGESPVTNAIPAGVTLWGLVDDAIKVDSQSVPEAWTNGAKVLSGTDVTGLVADLVGKSFQIDLYDWPDLPNGGDNAVRLGSDEWPFRVEWEWRVPIDIRMEPIWNSMPPPLDNPAGIVLGSNAWFHVDILPEGIVPEEKIVWTSLSNKLEFVTTNCGSRVQVRGDALGEDALCVEVEGAEGDFGLPPFHVKVMPLTVVTAKVGIVKNPNGMLAVSAEHATNIFANANKILLQAGFQVELNGSVQEIGPSNSQDYWNLVYPSASFDLLCSSLSQTGGLEIYFVHDIEAEGKPARGLCSPNGIVIASNGDGRTLAHEIFHACGTRDIYTEWPNVFSLVTGFPDSYRLPYDYGRYLSESGYELSQTLIIFKLLMYGFHDQTKGDIPTRNVYGAYYEKVAGTPIWNFGLVPVGLAGMTLVPESR